MNKKSLTYDILKELFNISIGKAADMLSEIINRKIVLKIPDVEFLDMNNEEIKLEQYIPEVLDGTLMVSSISFEKNLTGEANLIFPVKQMKTFINLCLNKKEKYKNSEVNFTDIDFDIIKEIGNIILNCIMGEVGNYLDINLNYTLPNVKIFDRIDFAKDIKNNKHVHILVISVTFVIEYTEIEGAIIIDLTLSSLNELMKRIAKIEDEIYE